VEKLGYTCEELFLEPESCALRKNLIFAKYGQKTGRNDCMNLAQGKVVKWQVSTWWSRASLDVTIWKKRETRISAHGDEWNFFQTE
jgi:hypothetical protein